MNKASNILIVLVFTFRAGGVEIRGLHATPIPKRIPLGVPVLEKNEFVPNFGKSKMKVTNFNIELVKKSKLYQIKLHYFVIFNRLKTSSVLTYN